MDRKNNIVDYQAVVVAASQVRELSAEGRDHEAHAIAADARVRARLITPRSSRAWALGDLFAATTSLDKQTRRGIVEDIAEIQRFDNYFRITDKLVGTLAALKHDRVFVAKIIAGMKGRKFQRRAWIACDMEWLMSHEDRDAAQKTPRFPSPIHPNLKPQPVRTTPDIDDRITAARAWPTAYQNSVGLTDLAQRVHRECRDRAVQLTNEAIERTRQIEPRISRANALRTMLNFAMTMDEQVMRSILIELASLESDTEEPPITESLISALVSSRRDVAFVDEIVASIEPEYRRAMASKAVSNAREQDRMYLPPMQPRSTQQTYQCNTLKGPCALIYKATKGRGRRWEHDWDLEWCRSAEYCGVRRNGIADWSRCEHRDAAHLRTAASTNDNHTP